MANGINRAYMIDKVGYCSAECIRLPCLETRLWSANANQSVRKM